MALIRSFLNTCVDGEKEKKSDNRRLVCFPTLLKTGTYFSRFLWVGGRGSGFTAILIGGAEGGRGT